MSLNFDYSKVADLDDLLGAKDAEPTEAQAREWRIMEGVIWATMAVDFGEITEGNWAEFYARMSVLNGLHPGWYPVEHYTPAAIKRRIGLHTNVTTLTDLQWVKKTFLGDRGELNERGVAALRSTIEV